MNLEHLRNDAYRNLSQVLHKTRKELSPEVSDRKMTEVYGILQILHRLLHLVTPGTARDELAALLPPRYAMSAIWQEGYGR